MKPVILLGSGGHASVVLELLRLLGHPVKGVCCPTLASQSQALWRELPVLGDDVALNDVSPDSILLANGVGLMPGNKVRISLFERYVKRGFAFITLVHPSAIISESVRIGQGVQVMAGAVIQADAELADNVIVNTRAGIDHDCRVGQHSHIAPGVTVCGNVTVGSAAFVGAGATVIHDLTIGDNAVIGAGCTVLSDISHNTWLKNKDNTQRCSSEHSAEK